MLPETLGLSFEEKLFLVRWGVGDRRSYDPGIEGFDGNVTVGKILAPEPRRGRVLREEFFTLS